MIAGSEKYCTYIKQNGGKKGGLSHRKTSKLEVN